MFHSRTPADEETVRISERLYAEQSVVLFIGIALIDASGEERGGEERGSFVVQPGVSLARESIQFDYGGRKERRCLLCETRDEAKARHKAVCGNEGDENLLLLQGTPFGVRRQGAMSFMLKR